MNQYKQHLHGLRYQLSAHFLFNMMNTLRVLIRKEPVRAQSLVNDLSEYLRYALLKTDHFYTTLDEEIKGIDLFFRLQEIRYQTKVVVKWEVTEDGRHSIVPAFFLQPLLEKEFKTIPKNVAGERELRVEISCNADDCLIIRTEAEAIDTTQSDMSGFIPESDVDLGLKQADFLLTELYQDRYKREVRIETGKRYTELIIPHYDENTPPPESSYR